MSCILGLRIFEKVLERGKAGYLCYGTGLLIQLFGALQIKPPKDDHVLTLYNVDWDARLGSFLYNTINLSVLLPYGL